MHFNLENSRTSVAAHHAIHMTTSGSEGKHPMNAPNQTPKVTDHELAEAISENFLVPAGFFPNADPFNQGLPRALSGEALSPHEAYRLIVEDRLLQFVSVSKAPTFEIERSLLGDKLVGTSRAGELFYTALELPSAPPVLKGFQLCGAHDVLLEAAKQSAIEELDFSYNPMRVINPNGVLEGEVINAFLKAAEKNFRRKSIQARLRKHKNDVAANLRKARDLIRDTKPFVGGILAIIELQLFHPTDAVCDTLKDSELAIKAFIDAVYANEGHCIGEIAVKRQFTMASGYFYRIWVFAPVFLTTRLQEMRWALEKLWQEHAGQGATCFVYADFGGDLRLAGHRLKVVLMADLYLRLAPDDTIRNFFVARRG